MAARRAATSARRRSSSTWAAWRCSSATTPAGWPSRSNRSADATSAFRYGVEVVWRCRKGDNVLRVNTPGARCWMSAWMRSFSGLGGPSPPNNAGKRCASSAAVCAGLMVGAGAAWDAASGGASDGASDGASGTRPEATSGAASGARSVATSGVTSGGTSGVTSVTACSVCAAVSSTACSTASPTALASMASGAVESVVGVGVGSVDATGSDEVSGAGLDIISGRGNARGRDCRLAPPPTTPHPVVRWKARGVRRRQPAQTLRAARVLSPAL